MDDTLSFRREGCVGGRKPLVRDLTWCDIQRLLNSEDPPLAVPRIYGIAGAMKVMSNV